MWAAKLSTKPQYHFTKLIHMPSGAAVETCGTKQACKDFLSDREGELMNPKVLITGGAGFIGSHLSRELLRAGYQVRVLDNLDPQVHPNCSRPQYLDADVELVVGDVTDGEAVKRSLEGVDMVCHLAAKVGVGQSMYEIVRYTQVNEIGTATLLEKLAETPF